MSEGQIPTEVHRSSVRPSFRGAKDARSNLTTHAIKSPGNAIIRGEMGRTHSPEEEEEEPCYRGLNHSPVSRGTLYDDGNNRP